MRFYKADLHLEGDRNHVVPKRHLSAPELAILMAIHGSIAVQRVEKTSEENVSHEDLKEQLVRKYGRSRIGDGDDRRPALRVVFPAWPNADLPLTAKAAGVPEAQMAGASPAEKTAAAKQEEELRAKWEAEREAEQEEFRRKEEALELERQQLEQDKKEFAATKTGGEGDKPLTEMQKQRALAESLGASEDQLKAANSKVKMQALVKELQDAGNGDSQEDDSDFME